MEIPEDRKWMYKRMDINKHLTEEFREKVYEFLQYVISQEKFQEQGEMLRCPCIKCSCKVSSMWIKLDGIFIKRDSCLIIIGGQIMVKNCHNPPVDVVSSCYGTCEQREVLGCFHQIIMDHVGPSNAHCMQPKSVIGYKYMEENPDLETQIFFNMFAAAQTPLWERIVSFFGISKLEI